jgi:hypothetical protein
MWHIVGKGELPEELLCDVIFSTFGEDSQSFNLDIGRWHGKQKFFRSNTNGTTYPIDSVGVWAMIPSGLQECADYAFIKGYSKKEVIMCNDKSFGYWDKASEYPEIEDDGGLDVGSWKASKEKCEWCGNVGFLDSRGCCSQECFDEYLQHNNSDNGFVKIQKCNCGTCNCLAMTDNPNGLCDYCNEFVDCGARFNTESEEVDIDKEEVAVKYDNGKLRYDLLDPYMLEEIVKVFTLGAEKYNDKNYLKGNGLNPERVLASVQRHIASYRMGWWANTEDGTCSHLSHAIAGLMMVLEIENKRRN